MVVDRTASDGSFLELVTNMSRKRDHKVTEQNRRDKKRRRKEAKPARGHRTLVFRLHLPLRAVPGTAQSFQRKVPQTLLVLLVRSRKSIE